METTTIVAIAVAAVFFLILIVWFFSTWNRLINLDENAQNAWNNIDVLLNQRYDMIPNMVSIVKGYAEHEAGIFDEFAKARQTAAGAAWSWEYWLPPCSAAAGCSRSTT